jgi:predicted Zn-dependent protease
VRLAANVPVAAGPLPDPLHGHDHDGYDAAVERLQPVDGLGEWESWRAAAAKTAIVSTRGVRAYEQRSFGELRVRRQGAPGRSLELTATAVAPGELAVEALREEAQRLLGSGEPVAVEPGEYAVVLGPWAMAEVVRRAGLGFGGPRSPLADRLGTRVAAPAVNLSDSPRFAATLPRSYDAEGAPRQPLPLVQDGVLHRVVEGGTGHAQGPGGVGGTVPEHLVLVGGGAADVSELAAPVERGLFIPALSLHGGWVVGRRGSALAEGVRLIRGGEAAEPVANLTVLFEPLELLAQVQALGARQRTVPSPLQRSARTASAMVAPAAQVAGGLFVAGPA